MHYRQLGKTNLQVSEIGLGCEGFVDHDGSYTKALIDLAEKKGINYVDLYSSDPHARQSLGEALQGRREKFYLQAHLCTIWNKGQYERSRDLAKVQLSFEDLLKRLRTDYIDVGMIHYVDAVKDWQEIEQGPLLPYALKLKQEGRIKYLGLSSHNPEAALAAIKSGHIDVLMFSINPCYDLQPGTENCEDLWADESYDRQLTNMDAKREELYNLCQSQGIGISVMKAYGGGDLLDAALSPAGKALTPVQCLHYALTRPAVATVMTGAHTPQELEAALAYETASEAEKDYAAVLASFPKISWEGRCMYCGHCAPCPQGIDVAMVTKFLNLCKAQKTVPETVREHYGLLAHHAGECIGCQACEKRCPFGVKVTANMAEAQDIFGR
jgi:predicted aldo/keto reductase-like oxidoreductase